MEMVNNQQALATNGSIEEEKEEHIRQAMENIKPGTI